VRSNVFRTMGGRPIRVRSLVALGFVAALLAVLASTATASPSFTWTGAFEAGQLTTPDWSNSANWTSRQVDLAPGVSITDVTVAPDHRVGLLEGGCYSAPQPFSEFTDLAANGSTLWNIAPGGDLAFMDRCIAPFYDHQGNAYFSGVDGNDGHHLVSYDASGNLRWSEPLLYGLNVYAQQEPAASQFYNGPYPSGPGDIAEGADGNIYLLDARDTGEFSSGVQAHLRSFNAQTGAPGLDIDLMTFVAAGQDTSGPEALLQTTSTGILVGTDQGVRFYSYSGQLQWDQSYWGADSEIPDLVIRDRTPDGGLLAADRYDVAGKCTGPSSDPAQVVIRLDKITANGLAYSVTIPSGTTGTCEDLGGPLRVHGTPDGGAVIVDYATFQGIGRTVTGIGPDGRVRWTIPVNDAALEDARVGADGTAVIIMHTTRSCATYYTCGRLVIRPVSATTGLPTAADMVIDTPDPSSSGAASNGVNLFFPEFVNAVADTDRLVIAYATTNDPSDPNPQYFRVDSIPVTGLGPDIAFNSNPPIPSGGGSGSSGGTGSGTESAESSNEATHKIPVVLVPGLKETSHEVVPPYDAPLSSEQCDKANDFSYLCNALTQAGFPVYVVSASAGAKKAVLDSLGDLNVNAEALIGFLHATVGQPALLVGHSMGGLIARIAISRYHAPAVGLFTIGTPHDGSFLADIATGMDGECLLYNIMMCHFRDLLAKWFPVNSTAVHEMTFVARALDNLTLAAPEVPVWTLAGTKLGPKQPRNYLFPNDLAVGDTSAHGQLANLGHQEGKPDRDLYHVNLASIGIIGKVLTKLLPAENELESPEVVRLIENAAQRLMSASVTSEPGVIAKKASTGHGVVASRKNVKVIHYAIRLFTAHVVSGNRPVSVSGLAVANEPFEAFCRKTAVSPIILPGGLFALDNEHATCAHLTAIPPRHHPIVVSSDSGGLRASVSIPRRYATIIVRSRYPLRSATLRLGKRTIRLQRRSKLYWYLTITIRNRLTALVTARFGKQVYVASVPL
jgi:pimeloyl-ACP methyl ester carboxylesterase